MNETDMVFSNIRGLADSLDDYGVLHLTLKKHGGRIKNADAVKVTSHKYTDNNPNVTAVEDILSLVKLIQDAGESGQLSFNIIFSRGHATQMQVQDFKKI